MSQSRIRKPKRQRPFNGLVVVLAFAILIVSLAGAILISNWFHSVPSTYETAPAKILETRNVVDRTRDTSYGGRIFYRAELHVQYLLDGKMQDRWLGTLDDLPSEGLALKLAAHPTKCLVYWPPNHPENAKCSLR
jgi:hypothetical protein